MKKQFIYNNKYRKKQRRHLRENMTEQELILWSKLKRKQLGVIFRRQYSIGPYFVDFYCPQKRLVIELDGNQHFNNKEYDEYRTQYFNSIDIRVVRFWNYEVDKSIEKVVLMIKNIVSPSSVEGDQGGVLI